MHAGYSAIEAANRAEAQLYAILNQQASLLSYLDCFVGLVVPACAGLVLAMVIKNFRSPTPPTLRAWFRVRPTMSPRATALITQRECVAGGPWGNRCSVFFSRFRGSAPAHPKAGQRRSRLNATRPATCLSWPTECPLTTAWHTRTSGISNKNALRSKKQSAVPKTPVFRTAKRRFWSEKTRSAESSEKRSFSRTGYYLRSALYRVRSLQVEFQPDKSGQIR